jgi:hypothetical protein
MDAVAEQMKERRLIDCIANTIYPSSPGAKMIAELRVSEKTDGFAHGLHPNLRLIG